MKQEMLRILHLNTYTDEIGKLMDVSMCLLSGECVGFLGLINSGNRVILDVLRGTNTEYTGTFYLEGRRILNFEMIQDRIYEIKNSNYLIDDWNVAEYMELVSMKSILGFYNPKGMHNHVSELFQELELQIDPDRKISELSELEKRLVDLAKAYDKKAGIIIIEDEFEGCSSQDIREFRKLVLRVKEKGRAIIVVSNSNSVSSIIPDKYIIFKKGRIAKKCLKEKIASREQLNKYLLGSGAITRKAGMDNVKVTQHDADEIIYSVENIFLSQDEIQHFYFQKGKVHTILTLDLNKKEYIFNALSGRVIEPEMKITLNGQLCDYKEVGDFVEHKIVAVARMGNVDELLPSMSVGENLMMPSLTKISPWDYFISEKKITKMLENEMRTGLDITIDNIKKMATNEYINLILERWYVYKPLVMILFEPFINCDVYGVSLVKSYIKKFVSANTTVVIVKSRHEYISDISDQIIEI